MRNNKGSAEDVFGVLVLIILIIVVIGSAYHTIMSYYDVNVFMAMELPPGMVIKTLGKGGYEVEYKGHITRQPFEQGSNTMRIAIENALLVDSVLTK